MHIGDVKLDSVHEFAAKQLQVMFTKYNDPTCGVVVRATCVIDEVPYAFEEPVEKEFAEEVGLRLSMHRCLRAILDDVRTKERG